MIPPRKRPTCGFSSTTGMSMSPPGAGTRIPRASSPTRCAATDPSPRTTASTVAFDTFYDRRNGFIFHANPLGGMADGLVTDERDYNRDWNGVWDVRARRFENGWTVGVRVSVQVAAVSIGHGADLGRQLSSDRAEEERDVFPVAGASRPAEPRRSTSSRRRPRSSASRRPPGRQPRDQALRHLEPRDRSAGHGALRQRLRRRRRLRREVRRHAGPDRGFHLQHRFRAGRGRRTAGQPHPLQPVLSRRSASSSSRDRAFSRSVVAVETAGAAGAGGAAARGAAAEAPGGRRRGWWRGRRWGRCTERDAHHVLQPAHRAAGRRECPDSRRRTADRPYRAVHNRATEHPDGAMSRAVGAEPTNFSVVRLKRDFLRRSSIGMLATLRSPSVSGRDNNALIGADANLAFYETVTFDLYYAKTRHAGVDTRDSSYRTAFEYNADKHGVLLDYLAVEPNFNPEIGFLRRTNFKRSYGFLRYSPRPTGIRAIRKVGIELSGTYLTDIDNRLDTRQILTTGRLEMNNGDRANIDYERNFEALESGFELAPGVVVPAGSYPYQLVRARLQPRTAAQDQRQPDVRPRQLLQRRSNGARVSRPGRNHATNVPRARPVAELGGSPGGELHDERHQLARDLHDVPAHVRRCAAPVPTPAPIRCRRTCDSAGSICRGAISSLCIAKGATR